MAVENTNPPKSLAEVVESCEAKVLVHEERLIAGEHYIHSHDQKRCADEFRFLLIHFCRLASVEIHHGEFEYCGGGRVQFINRFRDLAKRARAAIRAATTTKEAGGESTPPPAERVPAGDPAETQPLRPRVELPSPINPTRNYVADLLCKCLVKGAPVDAVLRRMIGLGVLIEHDGIFELFGAPTALRQHATVAVEAVYRAIIDMVENLAADHFDRKWTLGVISSLKSMPFTVVRGGGVSTRPSEKIATLERLLELKGRFIEYGPHELVSIDVPALPEAERADATEIGRAALDNSLVFVEDVHKAIANLKAEETKAAETACAARNQAMFVAGAPAPGPVRTQMEYESVPLVATKNQTAQETEPDGGDGAIDEIDIDLIRAAPTDVAKRMKARDLVLAALGRGVDSSSHKQRLARLVRTGVLVMTGKSSSAGYWRPEKGTDRLRSFDGSSKKSV